MTNKDLLPEDKSTCNSLYKAHTTCNKKPGKRAGGSGHARDYGGWGWERDLNCAPRSSHR